MVVVAGVVEAVGEAVGFTVGGVIVVAPWLLTAVANNASKNIENFILIISLLNLKFSFSKCKKIY